MTQLHHIWRRLAHCRLGAHREVVEPFGGYMLRERCVDCGRTKAIGWVVSASNRKPHPWKHPDA